MNFEPHFYEQNDAPNGRCRHCGYPSDDSLHDRARKARYTREFLAEIKADSERRLAEARS